jgi:HEAT repeat protein
VGRTLAERLADLPDGPARELAQSLAATLGQASHMPRPAPIAPQPTGPEQAAVDTRTVDELIAALADPDQKRRRVAALALGLRGDLAAVEPLIGAARDRSQWVRLAAVGSLGKLKDRRAFDILAERLHHDRDKDVRRSAAAALRQLKDPRAVAALTVGLTDEAAVAESAAKGLRALKAAPRMDVLLDLLRSGESPTRRWLAAVKLGELGDPSAVLPLLEVAEDTRETDWLRLRALEAAARLGDPRTADSAARILQTYTPSPDIVRDPSIRPAPDLVCMACRVAGRLGGPCMAPVLLTLLDDGNPHIRHAALEALGAVADSTAIPRLEELQQSDDASVPLEEPEQVGGIFMAGMRLVSLRVAAADAIRRIHRRGT